MAERVFALPDLGEGLEEAIVTAWLVSEGDEVELNQPIAEIETAKAAVEMPSPFAGRIVRLHAEAGSTLAVGAPLVTFDVAGRTEEGPPEPTPAADATLPPPPTERPGSVAATPAVRRLARELGVALERVAGTGPGGRLTREDVESAAGSSPPGAPAPEADGEEIPVSPTRRAIAARLTEAAAIPQVTTFRNVDCTALEAVRRGLGTSPLPLVVRALAEILPEHPPLNASWMVDHILLHRRVHVGIATDTERGLVVPVVRDVGALGVLAVAAEIERLRLAARDGALSPADVAGATIAVSNTGSYGSEAGTPLLNPGHAVTMALGVIQPKALVIDGRVEARPACTLSLTFDHRVLDGAAAGRAFGALVELLESRERLGALPP
jgi:pyruvate dehydrogenase E2 component (dihydrolipoamide acetyltransferase)